MPKPGLSGGCDEGCRGPLSGRSHCQEDQWFGGGGNGLFGQTNRCFPPWNPLPKRPQFSPPVATEWPTAGICSEAASLVADCEDDPRVAVFPFEVIDDSDEPAWLLEA